ncbi:MAG TPA: hypothetical protein VNH45_07570 [Gaiellaceae bacterium]|nr:hypothetical protein [Gaiellaceae bacterium]
MTRGLTLVATMLAMLAVAIPASATDAPTLKGVLVSVTPAAVAVKDAKGVVTTCARADRSPSLDGYAAGDRVQAACVRIGSKLVLAKIRRLTAPNGSPANDAATTKFSGAVTALTDASISLHDGDRDLTCSIGASSPSTASVKVGQHFTVACANGVLVAIAPVVSTAGRAYEGTVTAVSATSITVHTPNGDGTCTVGDGSPSVTEVKVGDRVLAGCKAGTNQLVLLKKLPATTEPPKPQTGAGTVSAVSPTSLTVHTDGGDLTCSVGDGSPSVADVKVGDKVKLGCVGGVLKALVRADTTPPPPPPPTGDGHTVTVGGTLSALSDTSLTVHGEHGDVTCTVPTTARLGDFRIGDRVGMACTDGVLAKLVKLT